MENHEHIPDGQEVERSIAEAIAALQAFRQNLYNYFSHRADAIIELIDALASNGNARTVVELSLSALFRREHSSIYDAIEHLFVPSKLENATQEQRGHEQGLLRLMAPCLPAPEQRKYWLFGTDVTYLPRQFADTLADRTYVHCPNPIAGNKPITIGHEFNPELLAGKGQHRVPALGGAADRAPSGKHRESQSSWRRANQGHRDG